MVFSDTDRQAVQIPQRGTTHHFWAAISTQLSYIETFLNNKWWQDLSLVWLLKWNHLYLFLKVRVLKTTKGFPIITALFYREQGTRKYLKYRENKFAGLGILKQKGGIFFFSPIPTYCILPVQDLSSRPYLILAVSNEFLFPYVSWRQLYCCILLFWINFTSVWQ